MNYCIPVFFLPINRDNIPDSLTGWHSVMPVLETHLQRRQESGLRTSTSRNWWYQYALQLICTGLSIPGLGFVSAEVVCLDNSQLVAAAMALDTILDRLQRGGIPSLGADIEAEGSIRCLRYDCYHGNSSLFSEETLRKAYEESHASYEVEDAVDDGYQAVVGFYSFLKSFRAVVSEALVQNKLLLYVQPQP